MMNLASIKHRFRRWYLYRIRRRGIDLCSDLLAEFRGFEPKIIFDVGANIGQSARTYAKHFPDSRIYSFEPAKETFVYLEKNLSRHENVYCFNYALGRKSSSAYLRKDCSPDRYRVVESDPGTTTEEITVRQLDAVCEDLNISRINLLKVDTEGHDLDVLYGALDLLNRKMIDIVQVECSMNRENTDHVSFERFKDFFDERHYLLYNLYELTPNWTTGEPFLRRCNAVFISERMNRENRIPVPWGNTEPREGGLERRRPAPDQ